MELIFSYFKEFLKQGEEGQTDKDREELGRGVKTDKAGEGSREEVEGDTEKRGERVMIVTREGAQGETDRQRRPGGETDKKRPRGEAQREKQGRKRCKAEERA